jgi:hypothetical protein
MTADNDVELTVNRPTTGTGVAMHEILVPVGTDRLVAAYARNDSLPDFTGGIGEIKVDARF